MWLKIGRGELVQLDKLDAILIHHYEPQPSETTGAWRVVGHCGNNRFCLFDHNDEEGCITWAEALMKKLETLSAYDIEDECGLFEQPQ